LAVLNFESECIKLINIDDVIDEFANNKNRRFINCISYFRSFIYIFNKIVFFEIQKHTTSYRFKKNHNTTRGFFLSEYPKK
jgi:hypothetical protein